MLGATLKCQYSRPISSEDLSMNTAHCIKQLLVPVALFLSLLSSGSSADTSLEGQAHSVGLKSDTQWATDGGYVAASRSGAAIYLDIQYPKIDRLFAYDPSLVDLLQDSLTRELTERLNATLSLIDYRISAIF